MNVGHFVHAMALDTLRWTYQSTRMVPILPRVPGQSFNQVWFGGFHNSCCMTHGECRGDGLATIDLDGCEWSQLLSLYFCVTVDSFCVQSSINGLKGEVNKVPIFDVVIPLSRLETQIQAMWNQSFRDDKFTTEPVLNKPTQ